MEGNSDVLDASASWMVPREVKDVWGEGEAGRESLGTYIRVIKGFVSYWYGFSFVWISEMTVGLANQNIQHASSGGSC